MSELGEQLAGLRWTAYFGDSRSELRPEQLNTIMPIIESALRQARIEAYQDALVLGCYCSCHSPASSRPSCLHCHPEHFEQGHVDPYCGLTLGAINKLRQRIAELEKEK